MKSFWHCVIVKIYFSLEKANAMNKQELDDLKAIIREKEEEVRRWAFIFNDKI